MTHDQMTAVIVAHHEGKNIESRLYGGDQNWQPSMLGTEPLFNFGAREYRIKPEPPKPREWWIRPIIEQWQDHLVLDHPPNVPDHRFVHVREVLPDEEGRA